MLRKPSQDLRTNTTYSRGAQLCAPTDGALKTKLRKSYLSGNFKGKKADERLFPLLQVVVLSSLLVGLSWAGVCVLFPQTIFGLLTDHTELIELLKIHVAWLLPALGFGSVALVLDGYFAGLAQGSVLRNTALVGIVLGFVPSPG